MSCASCRFIAAAFLLFACAPADPDPSGSAGAGGGGGQAGALAGAGTGGASGGSAGIATAAGAPSAGMATMAGTGGLGAAGSSGGSAGGAGGASGSGTSGATGTAGASGGPGAAGSGGGLTDPGTKGDGDIIIGPTYTKSPDLGSRTGPAGKTFSFTMSSTTSMFYTGMDATLTTRRSFMRAIQVHIPAKYVNGTSAPFMVVQDGAGGLYDRVRMAVDNLSQGANPERRLPAIVVIAVANGGGDSKGSQRGLEYDTMSDRYARFIDEEVIPAVVANASIKAAYPNFALTNDPEGRGTVGCSSGGAAAVTMAWFKPERFRRVIAYSATLVDQQDDDAAEETPFPLGAWEYHSSKSLIANSEQKPVRIFINANENDNRANDPESTYHNWLMANRRTAMALRAKNYHYRYVEGKGAGHCDGKVQDADVPDTMLWVWRGYPIAP